MRTFKDISFKISQLAEQKEKVKMTYVNYGIL